jgi:ABC-2 type transport system ATP-binding protein
MLIRLEHLTRYYGSLRAFHCQALELPRGAVGLLGPNGAGKSTLLRMLLGLLPASSGRAEVLGLDVARRGLEVRARVGYVSENDSFVPGLSALRFVALAGEICGLRRREAQRRAHEVLDFLGLEEARYRKIEEYSTGMKQLVKLAQALVHDPELLILDEPTNGLDPRGRRAMLELILRLHREEGKSFILSSHLLDDVERLCGSIIILEKGQVLASGRIDLLRASRRNRFRLGLRGATARFLELLEAAGARVEVSVRPGWQEAELMVETLPDFRPRAFFELVERANREQALEAGGAGGVVLRSLIPDEEKLEDTFRRLTSERPAHAR